MKDLPRKLCVHFSIETNMLILWLVDILLIRTLIFGWFVLQWLSYEGVSVLSGGKPYSISTVFNMIVFIIFAGIETRSVIV